MTTTKEKLMIRGITRREYGQIHYWLRKNFGNATKCENQECRGISVNYQWALRKDFEYEKKRENFSQLCKSCHSIQDLTEEGRKKLSVKTIMPPINCARCEIFIKEPCPIQKYCRECGKITRAESSKKWASENRDKFIGYQKKWFSKNRNYYVEYEKTYNRPKRKTTARV